MKIVRKSAFTDIIREIDLPITEEQVARYEQDGLTVQVAFPNLTEDQCEFFLTGVTPDEWEEFTFHSEDGEEDEYNRGYN
jgi:hypothetical protein